MSSNLPLLAIALAIVGLIIGGILSKKFGSDSWGLQMLLLFLPVILLFVLAYIGFVMFVAIWNGGQWL